MCLSCVHLDDPSTLTETPTCAAFPEGIPPIIYWQGRIDHRQPWAGDRGTRFDQDPGKPVFDFDLFEEVRGGGRPVPSG